MTEPIYSYNPRLDRLEKWLNYELSGGILFFLSFFYGIAFYVLGIAIAIFVPYLLYVLYQEKRFGWLGAFAIVILAPAALSIFFFNDGMWGFVINYSIIGLFFFYCFALKLTIPEWRD